VKIDPSKITDFERSTDDLQRFLLFSISVAGKNSKTIANQLWLFEEWLVSEYDGPTLFHRLRQMDNKKLTTVLKWLGFGCYNQRAKAFLSAAWSGINLEHCSISQLEQIHGVGFKTSRFFIMHSRPNAQIAVLDVHILKWLRYKGINAPKQTPGSSRRYVELEQKFLGLSRDMGRDPAELDLEIWNSYAKG